MSAEFLYFPNSGDRRLQRINHLGPTATSFTRFDYVYDTVGRITNWTTRSLANPDSYFALQYDQADQLSTPTSKKLSDDSVLNTFVYNYDLAGNRTLDKKDTVSNTSIYTVANRLVSRASTNFVHDAAVR